MTITKPFTKKQKKKYIKLIWCEIGDFIKDWQNNPCRWINERSIQTEFVERFKKVFKRHHEHKIWAKYQGHIDGLEGEQVYSRICCEPPIYYKAKKKKRLCRPDIVIWDNDKTKLLVCELKNKKRGFREDLKRKNSHDMKKLTSLFESKDVYAACCLRFYNERHKNSIRIKGNRERFRKYFVSLPSLR
ncbi:MAG TPA: hypothetical protein DCL35_07335 [Candidatus Omnitrophica bacterium]|nr:hypothetical protein [Candidatus Omnitrophota bacterium]